jgi:hypothetical protein
MNVDYLDGRRERLTGLNGDQVAQHMRRVTADPAFDRAEIQREKDHRRLAEEYGDNRHGRRCLESEERRAEARGSKRTPSKKRGKKR